jgi:hypothetical protein
MGTNVSGYGKDGQTSYDNEVYTRDAMITSAGTNISASVGREDTRRENSDVVQTRGMGSVGSFMDRGSYGGGYTMDHGIKQLSTQKSVNEKAADQLLTRYQN